MMRSSMETYAVTESSKPVVPPTDDPGQRKHDAKVHNEKVKLQASAINALGIALVGSAFVFPVIRDQNPAALLSLETWVWIIVGIGLHLAARATLNGLRRED